VKRGPIGLLLSTLGVAVVACGGGKATSDASGAAGHEEGAGGTAGTGGGAGGTPGAAGGGGSLAGPGGATAAAGHGGAAGAGRGGGGGAAVTACTAGAACDPGAAPCSYCDRGGTLQHFCQCTANGIGTGYWNCGGYMACGSTNCGLDGSICDPRTQTTCEQCDASGARRKCSCTPKESQGVWACASSTGACGVDCGDRKCLGGELCLRLGRYPGTLPPDGGTGVTLTPTCAVVPDACAGNQPSCAACIMSAYGCEPPGTCRDLGPQTFECILGGA
jgi:hypothetical protein